MSERRKLKDRHAAVIGGTHPVGPTVVAFCDKLRIYARTLYFLHSPMFQKIIDHHSQQISLYY